MEIALQHGLAWASSGTRPFDASQPAMVFVHGAQNDHSVWQSCSDYFAQQGFAILAPDLPAHGQGSGMALESIEAMADWLLALLQAAHVRHAHLVGHSMGSLVVLEAAARWAQQESRIPALQISRLSLLGTAFPMQVSPTLLTLAAQDPAAAMQMANPWSYYGQAAAAISASAPESPAPGPSLPELGLALKQRVAAASQGRLPAGQNLFHLDLHACNAYQNGMQAAARLQQRGLPSQCIIAAQDRMTPAKATLALRQQLGNPRVDILEHCGHDLMAEQPQALQAALLAFARS